MEGQISVLPKIINMQKLIALLIVLMPLGALAQTDPKTGYTNIEFIISKLSETKKISESLETRRKEYEKIYQDKVKDLQDKLGAYQKNAATMPEIIKKDKEKELENLQASLQEFQQNADTDIQNQQNNLLQPLYIKIYKAIQEVAEENKYQFIFNTGNGNQVRHLLVAPTDGDVSEMVIKKLESQSKQEESKAKAAEKPKQAQAQKADSKANAEKPTAKKPAPAKKPVAKKK